MTIIQKAYIFLLFCFLTIINFHIDAKTVSNEIIYVHTDRNNYIAGESVNYKMYLLDATTGKFSEISKIGYLVLQSTSSNVVAKLYTKLDSGQSSGSFTIPDTLKSGCYQLVGFTKYMKNQDESTFFKKELIITNRFDKTLDFQLPAVLNPVTDSTKNIFTDKSAYFRREKVKVSINNIPTPANISVSVSEFSGLGNSGKSLSEEISGLRQKQLPGESTYFSAEKKAKILSGKITDENSANNIENAIVLLSGIDSVPNLQYAITNKKGEFQLLIDSYYEGKELFLSIFNCPENKKWKISIDNDYILNKKWQPVLKNNSSENNEFLLKSQNIVYINKSYEKAIEKPDENQLSARNFTPKFFNNQVKTIYPEEFEFMKDLNEIAVEILPQVRIVKSNNKLYAQIINSLKEFELRSPAIFLDGVYIDDLSKIIDLNSEQIQKIEVISDERAFGDLIFGGMLSITSKNKEINKIKFSESSVKVMNEKFSRNKNFISLDSTIIHNVHTALFKQVLYWNPDIYIPSNDTYNFDFYSSDNVGEYIISIEGISEDGKPISLRKRFSVINQTKN